jgi:hypothetical protein
MTPERWKQVNALFHAVLEQPAGERGAFLARNAGDDPGLIREVESLLAAHALSAEFLETPAWGVAPELMLDGDESLVGKTIGPYRVIEEIGRGGMGVVYAAEDTRLAREVALKVLTPEFNSDPTRRERLRREARAVAALSHPAIATIYALEEIDGALYMVSELVRGHTLRAEVDKGPLPRGSLYPTLLAIADALAAAHARGIIHRDLKPENVIRGNDGQLKLVDFGLARTAGSADPTLTQLTMAGAAIGTPGYMAPEQMSGGVIDTRTDIYAFGVLAAELATGRHPFISGSAEWTAPEIEATVRRCLNAIPDQRFRAGDELLAALRELEAGGTPRALHDAAWWWRFHQGAMAIVLAVMPVLAWVIRGYEGIRPYGSWLFFAALTLATVSVTMRLNLLFIARVQPAMLPHHRARVFPAVPILDTGLALLMIGAAVRLAGNHDETAALIIGLGVVIAASVFLIEPATTRAARIGQD